MIIICANSHNHPVSTEIIAVNGDPDVAAEMAVERGAIFDEEWNCADCVSLFEAEQNAHAEMFDSTTDLIRQMVEDEVGMCHIPSCVCGGGEEHE